MPTHATSLSQAFGPNAIGPVVTAFQATNLQKTFTTSGWTGLTFTQGYQHDGASSLLIEVFEQVTVPPGSSFPFVTMATSALQVRADRPQMVYAFGSPGSGAAGSSSAFASADPVSLRLVWSGTPTLHNLSDAGLTSTFNQYIRQELGYATDEEYQILNGLEWGWGSGRDGYPNTSEPLRQAFAKNPYMKIFVALGYYDLATPYFAALHTLDHLGLDATQRDRIVTADYEAGHMVYVRFDDLVKLERDVEAFIDDTLPKR